VSLAVVISEASTGQAAICPQQGKHRGSEAAEVAEERVSLVIEVQTPEPPAQRLPALTGAPAHLFWSG
jgi:hypothetical protein